MKKSSGLALIEVIVILAIIGVLSAIILGVLKTNKAEACGFWSPCSSDATDQKQNEQESVTGQVSRLVSAVPTPRLEDSLERANISKRLTTFSDPAKISYIYLVSYGKVMAFYTVKGKITSGSKRLTAADQIVGCDQAQGWGSCVTTAPELDGTYGQSDPYIYFWTTDGTYVQWNGEYMMADQPLQLTTTPELVRTVK